MQHKGREERQQKRESTQVLRELMENIVSCDIVPDSPKSPEPNIVLQPIAIDKSTNREDDYERLLKTQADLEQLREENKRVLAENYILKTENDAINKSQKSAIKLIFLDQSAV